MLIRIDKYFINALNEAGFKVDYKTLVELYQKSKEVKPAMKALELEAKRETMKLKNAELEAKIKEKKEKENLKRIAKRKKAKNVKRKKTQPKN